MKAHLIIPTHEQTDKTITCLKSLLRHTPEVVPVWVDNGSSEESRNRVMPIIRQFSEYRTIWLSENTGFIRATNTGLKLILEVWKPDESYIGFLNNDVIVTPGWINSLIRVLEKDHTVGAVGPVTSECASWQSYVNIKQVLPVFNLPSGFRSMPLDQQAIKLSHAYGELFGQCRMVAFFCTLFRKEVFEKVGYLDEDFGFGYGDDDDLCHRMRKHKIKCAVAYGAYVYHDHQSTFRSIYSKQEIEKMKKNKLALFKRKHNEEARVT